MATRTRIGAGVLMFAGAIGLVAPSFAQPGNALPGDVMKIADALDKGNAAEARKLAAAAAKKYNLDDIMQLYRPRNKGGLSWGAKPGTNHAIDGLEKRIEALQKAVPANFAKEKANHQEALKWMAALLEITAVRPPPKGAVAAAAWNGSIAKLRVANAALAKAVAAGNAAGISKAATQVNTACVDCHAQFKQ